MTEKITIVANITEETFSQLQGSREKVSLMLLMRIIRYDAADLPSGQQFRFHVL